MKLYKTKQKLIEGGPTKLLNKLLQNKFLILLVLLIHFLTIFNLSL